MQDTSLSLSYTVTERAHKTERLLNKVPHVIIFFWVIKVLATTVGETVADFLSATLHLGLVNTSYVMSGAFLVLLFWQLRLRRYVAGVYWGTVVFISVVGTLISDSLVDKLGVPLQTTTVVFSCVLAVIFFLWWRTEHTLSVHEINTTRRELFYWAAILFTFALGTSGGDLLAEASGLGYALSALSFASLIGVTALAFRLKLNGVVAFWIASFSHVRWARRWATCFHRHAKTAASVSVRPRPARYFSSSSSRSSSTSRKPRRTFCRRLLMVHAALEQAFRGPEREYGQG